MAAAKTIRALSRGLAVLRALEAGQGLTLHGLAGRTGLPKPTLLRILGTLEEDGYVRRGLGDALYRATVRDSLARSQRPADLLAELAAPVLDRLCQKVLWPSDLGIYADGAMRIVETTRRHTPFLVNPDAITYRIHMFQSAMGRVHLAYCGPEERQAILAVLRASSDPHDWPARQAQAVEEMIAEVRERGYAVRAKGYIASAPSSYAEMSAIAVPVLHRGRAVATVTLVWITSAVPEAAFVEAHLPLLRDAAGEIGERFGERLRA